MKKLFSIILAVFLLVAPLQLHAFADNGNIDVLALGDSLAFGINEKGELGGRSYSDYLALTVEGKAMLKTFNKGFSWPGYKTADVLKDIQNNASKRSIDMDYKFGAKQKIVSAIQNAEIITLSIGANDVLQNIKKDADGQFQYNITEVSNTIEITAKNIDTILKEIKRINKDATIIFMGYYNPFPSYSEYAFALNYLVTTFDTKIEAVVSSNGATFVQVKDLLASNAASYIPNPDNIHLSDAGYKAVADAMANSVDLTNIVEVQPDTSLPVNPQPTSPIETPKDVKGHWGENYILEAMKMGLFNGYGDGSFKPNQAIKRIEMTSILARTFKLPNLGATLPFNDLTKIQATMVQELQSLYSLGITKGDGTGKFNPNQNISREQFALLFLRSYEKLTNSTYDSNEQLPFKDLGKLTAESVRAIQFLFDNKLVDRAEKFNPKDSLTRAQAAKMLSIYEGE